MKTCHVCEYDYVRPTNSEKRLNGAVERLTYQCPVCDERWFVRRW